MSETGGDLAVDREAMGVAKASYERCQESDAFFRSFYRNFLAACPQAEPMFAKTDFDRQIRLLRHAIGLLLIFSTQPKDEPTILTRVAERHSRENIDAAPKLYGDFVDALIDTVAEFDPAFTADVAVAWRRTVASGIAYMQSKY